MRLAIEHIMSYCLMLWLLAFSCHLAYNRSNILLLLKLTSCHHPALLLTEHAWFVIADGSYLAASILLTQTPEVFCGT